MPIASETGIIPAKTACLNFARLKGAFIRIVTMPAIPVQLARNNRSSARFAVLLQVRHRYTWHMSPRLIADCCLARRADDWQVTRPCNIPIGIVMPRVNTLLPFLSAIAGVAIFSVMDALMKRASIAADVYNALLFRSLIGAALMLPLWLLTGGRWPEAPLGASLGQHFLQRRQRDVHVGAVGRREGHARIQQRGQAGRAQCRVRGHLRGSRGGVVGRNQSAAVPLEGCNGCSAAVFFVASHSRLRLRAAPHAERPAPCGARAAVPYAARRHPRGCLRPSPVDACGGPRPCR